MSESAVLPERNSGSTSALRCGAPGNSSTCFTRFILPFAYQPSRDIDATSPGHPTGARWREARAGDQDQAGDWLRAAKINAVDSEDFLDGSRNQYLTKETASVLFERAKWLVLEDSPLTDGAWRAIRFKEGSKIGETEVKLRPPALLLFEWPDGRGTSCCSDVDELCTGLLIIEACFPSGISLGGLLRFNELFRYWRQPFAKHRAQSPELVAIAEAFPGQKVTGAGNTAEQLYSARWSSLLELPFHGSGSHWRLIPEKWLRVPTENLDDSWRIHADDRAFVSGCAILNEKTEAGEQVGEIPARPESPLDAVRQWGATGDVPDQIGYWLRLLNVDGAGSDDSLETLNQCSRFERDWLETRTYKRWLHSGAAYGYTAHSAMMLSGPCDEPPTCMHFRQMYFDQLLLGLYMRSSLFRFSQSLSRISAGLRNRALDLELAEFQKQFQQLRMRFDIFTNLYQFPLLSNQQQGVEMYQLMREQLDIQTIYNEVHAEIDGTHEVIELQVASQLNRLAALLGVIGFTGVMAGVVQAVMSLWGSDGLTYARIIFWIITALFLAGLLALAWLQKLWLPGLLRWFNREKQNRCQRPGS